LFATAERRSLLITKAMANASLVEKRNPEASGFRAVEKAKLEGVNPSLEIVRIVQLYRVHAEPAQDLARRN
jgi:hypothetical protein